MSTKARTRMIEVTGHLLRSQGYHGTSLKSILNASGAPRGSLYYYFPGGKGELVLEALLEEVRQVTGALSHILVSAPDPVSGVKAYYEAAAQVVKESDYRLGCPVAPVILDALADSAALEEACRDALAEWQAIIGRSLERAGLPAARADSLAALAVSALEGALLVARARRDVAPIGIVAKEVGAAIEAALNGAVKGG